MSRTPQAVLAYLARYTHRVAISNSRLVDLDERGITFRYKGLPQQQPGAVSHDPPSPAAPFMHRFRISCKSVAFHVFSLMPNPARRMLVWTSCGFQVDRSPFFGVCAANDGRSTI
jgi:hypothetical protein